MRACACEQAQELRKRIAELESRVASFEALKGNEDEGHCQACIGDKCTAGIGCVAMSLL